MWVYCCRVSILAPRGCTFGLLLFQLIAAAAVAPAAAAAAAGGWSYTERRSFGRGSQQFGQ